MKYIPNTITLANLFCGCLSIVATFSGEFVLAGGLIFLAAIFDFLDGLAARVLNAYSELGKQLDSLADLVSFGVAPAMLAFGIMFVVQTDLPSAFLPYILFATQLELQFAYLPYIAFIMVLFSALRLAKYNVDTSQSEHFTGMPTPANAMFWASLPLVLHNLYEQELTNLQALIFNPVVLAVLCVIFALLLVLPIPMLSFKFKNIDFKPNWQRHVLIWLVIGLFFFFEKSTIPITGVIAIPIAILIYPLFSFTIRKKNQ